MPIARMTREQFIAKSRQRWGEKYGYDGLKYVNSRTPVLLYCFHHQHYFSQTPKAHFAAKHECCPLCYQAIAGRFQNAWRDEQIPPKPSQTQYFHLIQQVFRLHHH
ncbi:hypothetical protein L1D15_06780 [Vibrio sp. Isolate25]|uniref:hypothetical protein n=1 Tax=Vibrio sp. Isolate25 TaxID=2908535 RepID=UPI001EFEB390|nr:hypothetical protein [Vibrio sp. Isolate25]MCG9596431.1 hypothetical protein [Vibrio sp. Isolate25]